MNTIQISASCNSAFPQSTIEKIFAIIDNRKYDQATRLKTNDKEDRIFTSNWQYRKEMQYYREAKYIFYDESYLDSNRLICSEKVNRSLHRLCKYYFVQRIKRNTKKKPISAFYIDLELKYLNQTVNIRISEDIDGIKMEYVLNLPYYDHAERIAVKKAITDYVLNRLMKKRLGKKSHFLGLKNKNLKKIKKIIKKKYSKSNFNKIHTSFITLNNDYIIVKDINNRLKLFGLYFGDILKFHDLILKINLIKEVWLRLFFGSILDGLKFHSRFMGVDWYELRNDIRVGFDGNNILNVFCIGNGADDIADTMATADPFDKFFSILNRLYMALNISAGDVISVSPESGHICHDIDIGGIIDEVYGVPILNKRNDNKKNLMYLNCIGFFELIDKSCMGKSVHSHHEVHFNNHNNLNLEEFLNKIDYLFNIGRVYNEMLKTEKAEFNKIFPTSKRLREIFDGYARLEAMGIEFITPFDITANDICGVGIKAMISRKLRFVCYKLEIYFLRIIKKAYSNYRFYKLGQDSEMYLRQESERYYYKFWLEK